MGAVKETELILNGELAKDAIVSLIEYGENSDWFNQQFDEMRERYGGQTVLVINQEVIFSGEDAEEARRELRNLGNRMNSCYSRYVPRVREMRMM